jgi:acyl-CoA thioesterase-1
MYKFSPYRRHILAGLSTVILTNTSKSASAQKQTATPLRILVVGDSLSAEYGLRRKMGWVSLLEQKLKTLGETVELTNASISGDTTSGGRSRLAALLTRHTPQIVIIELGGNDALRGLPLTMSQANLTTMVEQAQQANAKVILVGMQIPPNYGREYGQTFKDMFQDVSTAKKVPLVPFLLEGIGPQNEMFQSDGIHPNESAQPIMMETVLKVLLPVIKGLD